MDNDDLRRGRPTCHRAFDEATAILVGDALQARAFEVLANAPTMVSAHARLEMLRVLADAIGTRGMAGGQAIDLESVKQTLDEAAARTHASPEDRRADPGQCACSARFPPAFKAGRSVPR